MQNRQKSLVPCTALGCMELLTRSEIDLNGKEAVLMGDSNVVGTPLAMLLRTSGIAALTLCRYVHLTIQGFEVGPKQSFI